MSDNNITDDNHINEDVVNKDTVLSNIEDKIIESIELQENVIEESDTISSQEEIVEIDVESTNETEENEMAEEAFKETNVDVYENQDSSLNLLINELSEKISPLTQNFESVVNKVENLESASKALQKAVTGFYTETTDSMHKEIERYRKGLVRTLKQELFGELIDIYDKLSKAIISVTEKPEKAIELFEGIREHIECELFNRSVEKKEALLGEKFNPREHHAIRPEVLTGDETLDGTIAEIVNPGFYDVDEMYKDLREGCLKLRAVNVRLYKFDSSMVQNEPIEIPQVDCKAEENKCSEPETIIPSDDQTIIDNEQN